MSVRLVPVLLVLAVAFAGCSEGRSAGTQDTTSSSSATGAPASHATSTTVSSSLSKSTTTSASKTATTAAATASAATATVKGDGTPPVIQLSPAAVNGASVQLTVKVQDATGVLSHVEYGRTGNGGVTAVCPKDNGTSGKVVKCLRTEDVAGSGTYFVQLTGLDPNVDYVYWVVAVDADGNRGVRQGEFTTGDPASAATTSSTSSTSSSPVQDTVAPTIVNLLVGQVTNVGATLSYSVGDNNGGSGVAASGLRYGPTTALGQHAAALGGAGSRSVTLTGLQPGTTYYVQVVATDGEGNEAVLGPASTPAFTTSPAPTITGLDIIHDHTDKVRVSWTVDGTSAVTSRLDYGTTTAYGTSTAVQAGPGGKVLDITGLVPGTLYHFRVSSAEGTLTDTDTSEARTVGHLTVTINGVSSPSFSHVVQTIAGHTTIVDVRNDDSVTHDWQLDSDPTISTVPLGPGSQAHLTGKTFTAGTYPVHCNFHGGMTGSFTIT